MDGMMRSTRLIGVVFAVLAVAWIADRAHQAAVLHVGSFPFQGGAPLLLAADRIPKLILLAALGWVAFQLLRVRERGAMGTTLVVIGAVVGLAPALIVAITLGPVPGFVVDVLLPAQFVPWTGAGLVVVGALALAADRLPSRTPDAWIIVGAAVVLIACTWAIDAWLNAAFAGLATSAAGIRTALVSELTARLATMAAVAILAWLVLRAEPASLPALAMLGAGLVAFIGFALVAVFVVGPPSGPGTRDVVPVTGWTGRWVSGAIVLLGTSWMVRSLRTENAPRPEPGASRT